MQAACALLRPCHSHLPRRPRAHPEKHSLTQEQPARPSRARRPAPSVPRHPRHPCVEKRKRLKPLEALRAARTTPTRASRPPAPPCDPLAVSSAVCAPVPVAVSNPYPSSASVGFRSSGSPFPRPPLPPVAFPSQPPPLVAIRLFAPAAPFASRHRFPPVPLAPHVPPTRARRPSSGYLPLLPLHRSSSARLFLRATSHALRPCRTDRTPAKRPANNEPGEHSLCVHLRRTRSKKKGSVSAPPPRMTRVSVQPQRINLAFPPYRSGPAPLRPTASRQRPP